MIELSADAPHAAFRPTGKSIAEVVDFYGSDVMLLVGGNLLVEAGAVETRARSFVTAVRAIAAAS